jgi:hypothetical protein
MGVGTRASGYIVAAVTGGVCAVSGHDVSGRTAAGVGIETDGDIGTIQIAAGIGPIAICGVACVVAAGIGIPSSRNIGAVGTESTAIAGVGVIAGRDIVAAGATGIGVEACGDVGARRPAGFGRVAIGGVVAVVAIGGGAGACCRVAVPTAVALLPIATFSLPVPLASASSPQTVFELVPPSVPEFVAVPASNVQISAQACSGAIVASKTIASVSAASRDAILVRICQPPVIPSTDGIPGCERHT